MGSPDSLKVSTHRIGSGSARINKSETTDPMTTATAYATFTAEAAQLLTVAVNSSAISRLGIIIDNDNMPHLLVIFKSNESKVYRYIFEDDLSSGAAYRWNELLNDDDARNETSWGSELHRALKHGDLETINI